MNRKTEIQIPEKKDPVNRRQTYIAVKEHDRLAEYANHYGIPLTQMLSAVLKWHDAEYSHVLKGEDNG